MASLTTTYMVSTLLTSVGAMAAGFAAQKIAGPTIPVSKEPEPEPEPDQTQTVVKMFDVDEKTASDIIELFVLDEAEYAAKDKNEANDKLKAIYDVISTCSDKLKPLCSVMDTKIRTIAFLFGNTTQDNTEPLGDQSALLNEFIHDVYKNKK